MTAHLTTHLLQRRPTRSGFTLVELLVVIGILAILAGLLLAGVGTGLSSARELQTKTIITLIDGSLQERIDFYNTRVLDGQSGASRYYRIDTQVGSFLERYGNANSGNAPTSQSATLFVRKHLFASIFPQRFQDLCGFDGRPGAAGVDDNGDGFGNDVTATDGIDIKELGLGGATSDDPPSARAVQQAIVEIEDAGGTIDLARHSPKTESSELLYICLTRPFFSQMPVLRAEDIPQNYLSDSDNDGLIEINDGWGEPLQFYTFTTGLFRPTEWTWQTTTAKTDVSADEVSLAFLLAGRALTGQPLPVSATDRRSRFNTDTDDRFGAVRNPTNTAMGTEDQNLSDEFSLNARPLSGGGDVTTPGGAPGIPIALGTYSVPMIVSAGPDGVLGLGNPVTGDPVTTPPELARFATPIDPAAASDNLTNAQRGVR